MMVPGTMQYRKNTKFIHDTAPRRTYERPIADRLPDHLPASAGRHVRVAAPHHPGRQRRSGEDVRLSTCRTDGTVVPDSLPYYRRIRAYRRADRSDHERHRTLFGRAHHGTCEWGTVLVPRNRSFADA